MKRRSLLLALFGVALLATAVLLSRQIKRGAGRADGGSPIAAGPNNGPRHAPKAPIALAVPSTSPKAAVRLAIHEPAKLERFLESNAWLRDAAREPLGRGFVGSWAGVLGSTGFDLGATFAAALLEYLPDTLFGDSLHLAWYSGGAAPGVPAVVMPSPGAKARAAYRALDEVALRGTLEASHCPGEERPVPTSTTARPPPQHVIARWSIADHMLYAGSTDRRLVLARSPIAVLLALCEREDALLSRSGPDVDLELGIVSSGFGREVQTLFELLGLDRTSPPRIAFAVEGDRLVPRGLRAKLDGRGRLGTGALTDELLGLVPADLPVLLGLELELPAALSKENLRGWFGGIPTGDRLLRQVTLLWNPRGDPDLPTEIALVWSRPEDRAALLDAFSGPNAMHARTIAGQLVLSSSEALLGRIEQASKGAAPSMRFAPPSVVAGLKANAAVALGINLGALLSELTLDAWIAEQTKALRRGPIPTTPPPHPAANAELERARRRLEELPFLGFRGVLEGAALLPEGFRS